MMRKNKIYGRLLGLVVLSILSFQFSIVTAQELLNYPLDTINGEEVYQYRVEKSIGLYRIGVNFDVPQADIIRLNPQLKERGVRFDEMLLIPTKRPVVKEKQKPIIDKTEARNERLDKHLELEKSLDIALPAVQKDTASVVVEPAVEAVGDTVVATDSTVVFDTRKVIELALLLPFESQQTKRSGNADRMMEFYQGALLALRDLQNDSTRYRLHVYDTERSERRIRTLCDSTDLENVQAVLGLVYPIQIEIMTDWCAKHNVPLLLPFSDDMRLEDLPQVLQFNSTDKQEADSLCQWIIERQEDLHCVAVEVREADLATSARVMRKQLRTNEITYTSMNLRDLMNDSCAYALDSTRENLIILHSDRFQHIRLLLPHLQQLQAQGYRIRLISQYSWQKEQLGLPQLYTSVFTNETSREAYDAQWDKLFITDHVSDMPRYDLLGYDLMRALVGWLHGEKALNGLQSSICWRQVGNGGWQNACTEVVMKN